MNGIQSNQSLKLDAEINSGSLSHLVTSHEEIVKVMNIQSIDFTVGMLEWLNIQKLIDIYNSKVMQWACWFHLWTFSIYQTLLQYCFLWFFKARVKHGAHSTPVTMNDGINSSIDTACMRQVKLKKEDHMNRGVMKNT